MSEIVIGSWKVDLAAGTACNAGTKVTILELGDRTFKVEYSGEMPEQGSYAFASEVFDAFERAGVAVIGQCCPTQSINAASFDKHHQRTS